MLEILKSQFIGNLTKGFTLIKYSFFRHINHFRLYVFLRCSSCFFLYQVTKIAC